jgi:hypothetical protein
VSFSNLTRLAGTKPVSPNDVITAMMNIFETAIPYFPFATTVSGYSPYHICDYTFFYTDAPATGQTIALCGGHPFIGFSSFVIWLVFCVHELPVTVGVPATPLHGVNNCAQMDGLKIAVEE